MMVFKVFQEKKQRRSGKKVDTHSFEEKLPGKAQLIYLNKSQNTGIFQEKGTRHSKVDYSRDLTETL